MLAVMVLRRYRLAARLTQAQPAARAHVSARTIGDLERGARHTPRRATVLRLARALGLPAAACAALIAAARPAERPHDCSDRLGTPYIDLYLLHRDDPSRPVGPIIECLNDHLRAGRIRAFDGSNWTQERLAAVNAYAAQRGLAGFVAGSPNFSLAVPNEPPWPGCVAATIDG